MKDTLNEQLARIVGKDRILDSDLWRHIYGRDASYFDITPKAVVRPTTTEQVQSVLALATRERLGVTFRTGGTSLCGQTVNNGIICELRTAWHNYEIRNGGEKVWFEPGLTAEQVNAYLSPHHRHIGPDPASKSAAMMGGILANNSSGMAAGVKYNSYHTLSSIEFVLANGNRYNTASEADRKRFRETERELCAGLMKIREEILANGSIRNKIVEKYRIKNVTGYGMNSFVDFDDPVDIFSHLLIGSEGTLAFIVSAELNTVPSYNVYSSTLLYFPDVVSAAASAAWLGESGAISVELMDYASLRSYMGLKLDRPKGTTAMLVDYGANSPDEMLALTSSVEPQIRKLENLASMDPFSRTVEQRNALWKMRNGIFPCVAGVRDPGATVVLEDVAAPVEVEQDLVEGIQRLFGKYGYEGAIFGHARDGNMHPLLTSAMETERDKDNFRLFMDDLVDHVINLNGSLKGEHGTGRAIAPFVAREWGDDIYNLMKQVKRLADPAGILNPGVLINSDPDCFMENIKHLDLFGKDLGYGQADMCMECGYCEHVCPTRDITLTPRQRLQAQRIIRREGEDSELARQYRFIGEQSCCSDGSCQVPCPMGINTAVVTDAIRERTQGRFFHKALNVSAKHYGDVETAVRGMLKVAVDTGKVISPYPLIWATDLMHRLYSQVPHWSKYFPYPAKIHYNEIENPDYIYFPACVTRIFGASSLGKDDLITVILRIASRAGLRVAVPKSVHGVCCSQIWEHKGDLSGQRVIAEKTVDCFYKESREGAIPIFCDTTSCTHTLLTSMKNALSPAAREKFDRLKILDITQWLHNVVLPRVKVTHPKGKVLLHPTCAANIMGVRNEMVDIAKACAREVVVPVNTHCCGAAGDRGFLYPKVAQAAVTDERNEVGDAKFDGCYSLARTCEISLDDTMGRIYESIPYLVDEAIE